MSELLQPFQENQVANTSGMTVGKIAQELVGQIGIMALQQTLDEGGTIEIPSLGLVFDKFGVVSEVIDLDESDYTIE